MTMSQTPTRTAGSIMTRQVLQRAFLAPGEGVSVETSAAWPARERYVAQRWQGSQVTERRYAATAADAGGMAAAMLSEASIGSHAA